MRASAPFTGPPGLALQIRRSAASPASSKSGQASRLFDFDPRTGRLLISVLETEQLPALDAIADAMRRDQSARQ